MEVLRQYLFRIVFCMARLGVHPIYDRRLVLLAIFDLSVNLFEDWALFDRLLDKLSYNVVSCATGVAASIRNLSFVSLSNRKIGIIIALFYTATSKSYRFYIERSNFFDISTKIFDSYREISTPCLSGLLSFQEFDTYSIKFLVAFFRLIIDL